LKIGICGLGKVGLPIALALAVHGGHEVTGYDISTRPWDILDGKLDPPMEAGIGELLAADHRIARAASPGALAASSDLVIIAVPTPHPDGMGGDTSFRLDKLRDFDYTMLADAAGAVCHAAKVQEKLITVQVLSTVLPGTMRRLILPLGNEYTRIVYSPAFISLGTTIADFSWPPFVICGTEPGHAGWTDVRMMYGSFDPQDYPPPFYRMSTESAEVAKMAYNMLGSVHIEFANMVQQMCHGTGADCDAVTGILDFAPQGVRAGLPDGGPCRPRDLAALTWLSGKLDMASDLPHSILLARESHAIWLAVRIRAEARKRKLPVVLMGTQYKPETDLEDGSPALLLKHYLDRYPQDCTVMQPDGAMPDYPAVYVITVRLPEAGQRDFPPGSVVFDPWGITARHDIEVIRPGRL